MTIEERVNALLRAAQLVYKDNPVMQKVVVTQALLESGYLSRPEGSQLARDHNNLFGIKGKGDLGSVMMPTTEYVHGKPIKVDAPFAKFSTVYTCFERHKDLMSRGVSWNRALYLPVLEAKTTQEAFKALLKAGYATDPKYPGKLQAICDKYLPD